MQINYEDGVSPGKLKFTQTIQIKCMTSSHFMISFMKQHFTPFLKDALNTAA